MTKEKHAEYLMLRDEIADNLKMQQNWSRFAITATITIIGFAPQLPNFVAEMYLLPLVVLLLSSAKVSNYRSGIQRTVSYMIVRHETPDGFYWETSLNLFRDCSEKHENKIIRKIREVVETQEFSMMALLCMILYNVTLFRVPPDFLIFRAVLFNIISILAILIIYVFSKDYWSFNGKMSKKFEDIWKSVFDSSEITEKEEENESDESGAPNQNFVKESV